MVEERFARRTLAVAALFGVILGGTAFLSGYPATASWVWTAATIPHRRRSPSPSSAISWPDVSPRAVVDQTALTGDGRLHLSKISLGTYCSQRLSAISPGFEIGEDVLDYVFRVEEGHGEIWIDGIVSPAQVECESPWRDQEMT